MNIFTAPDAWYGSSFDLTLYLHKGCDPVTISTRFWSLPIVDGCYLERYREPSDQTRIAPSDVVGNTPEVPLLGVATLPNGSRVACSTFFLGPDHDCSEFLVSLPLGSLASAYQIGAYPIDDGTPLDWRRTLEDWFFAVSAELWSCGVVLGTIGAGTAGSLDASSVLRGGIPAERWEAFLWPGDPPTLHRANMPAPIKLG